MLASPWRWGIKSCLFLLERHSALWSGGWVGLVASLLLSLLLSARNLSCKCTVVRPFGTPALPVCPTWYQASILWVEAGHTHLEFSVCHMWLGKMRKTGDLHFLGRDQNPQLGAGGEGSPVLTCLESSFHHVEQGRRSSNGKNLHCSFSRFFWINVFFFICYMPLGQSSETWNNWVFKNKVYHQCLFHWGAGPQSSSRPRSKAEPSVVSRSFTLLSLTPDSEHL